MLKLQLLQHRTSTFIFKLQCFTFRFLSHSHSPSNSASSRPSFSSSSSSLAEAILKCRSVEEALKLFETSSKIKISKTKDLRHFTNVIHVLPSAHKYTLARCLIKSLIESLRRNSKPNDISYRVFNALDDIQTPKLSIGVFSLLIMEFLEMGLFEEALWCRSGNMSEAMGWCSEMESLNLSPDVFTYTILINGLCTEGRLAEANRLFQRMKDERIFPSSVTYNSLIHGYCKEHDMEKVLDLCSEMTASGVEPEIITFSTLIDGYCKVGNIKASMGLYSETTIKSIVPDVVTYTALIDAHFKEANMKEALKLYSDMLEAGIQPNGHTFACLVDGFWKEGKISNAIDFYLENKQAVTAKAVAQIGCWNHVGFTCLIQGLCQNGYILRASRLFSDMRSSGITPDLWSYVLMLKGHLQEKRVSDTMMLHCDMINTGILPNLLVSQLLAMLYQENGYLRSACFLTNPSRLGSIS